MGKQKYPPIKIGNRYGKLIVESIGRKENGRQYWVCKCDCGNYKEIIATSLKKENGTRSCGCLSKDNLIAYNSQKHIKTFYDWCIENKLPILLNRWDNKLNTVNPNQIGFKSNKAFWFKCLDNPNHKSELFRLDNGVEYYNKYGSLFACKQCSFYSFAQWGFDNICNDFLDKYWDYELNSKNPWEIPYSYNGYVFIKCVKISYHTSYKIKCNNYVNGNRCPCCTNHSGKVHILDSLGLICPDSIDVWSSQNVKTPYNYSKYSNQYVYWKCENGEHGD